MEIKKTVLSAFIAILLPVSVTLAADVQYDIKVDGITCPFCVATSEKALKKVDGIHVVGADLKAGIITVCGDENLKFTDEQLKKLFRKKGLSYRSFSKTNTCKIEGHEHKPEVRRKRDES